MATLVAVCVSPAAAAKPVPLTSAGLTHDQAMDKIGDYYLAYPEDFIGLAAVARSVGVDEPKFSFPKAGLTDLSPSQAQQASSIQEGATPYAVPVDAFTVTTAWYRSVMSDGTFNYTFIGYWNFRDNYVNGSAPDDVSAVAVGSVPTCWKHKGDKVKMADYKGKDTSSSAYRYQVDLDSSIWQVRDRVSGFVMNSDHGQHELTFSSPKTECDRSKVHGKYYYEKNQDGNGGWSASVSIKVLTVSYSGSKGSVLRKATAIDYYL